MKLKTDRWVTALRVFCLIWNNLIHPAARNFQERQSLCCPRKLPVVENAKTPNLYLRTGIDALERNTRNARKT